jgi:hypothetical protein
MKSTCSQAGVYHPPAAEVHFISGARLTDRVPAVGTPYQNAREDAGLEQTCPQPEMHPCGGGKLTLTLANAIITFRGG